MSMGFYDIIAPFIRIVWIGIYAAALYTLAISFNNRLKQHSDAVRRSLSLVAIAILGHGLWLIAYFPAGRPAGLVEPHQAAASQLVIIGVLAITLRLMISKSRSKNPRLIAWAIGVLSGLGSLIGMVTGMMSQGLPVRLIFSPLPSLLLVLSLVPMVLVSTGAMAVKGRQSFSLRVLGASLGITLAAAGTRLAFQDQGSMPHAVSMSQAWLFAGVSGVVLCLIIWSFSKLFAHLRYVEQLEHAIEALPVGMALFTDRDKLLIWNSSFLELSRNGNAPLKAGMSYVEALKAGMKSSLFPPGKSTSEEWLFYKQQHRRPGDWLSQTDDGLRWIRLQNRRISKRGMVTITSDFTEQKKHEAELAKALEEAQSANLAKSRFLANMSHEIRTPLNGVIAVTEALSRSLLTPKQTEMVELIRSSSSTLQCLLSDILDLARIESGEMNITVAPFDFERLVTETQQLYANSALETGVQFSCDISPDARSWVMGDAVRTRQILSNILSNAIKFTHEGHIALSVNRHGDMIYMQVEDTGIGFEASKLNKLFDRFQQADDQITRKYGGSGLGLAISVELAEKMGGSIQAQSQPGRGSRFTVALPLKRITAPLPSSELASVQDLNRTAKELSNPTSQQNLRILLADDNATNRRVVQLILDTNNIQLMEVENGQLALDALEVERFDLILMDMQMPVMDGLTATRLIRERETRYSLHRTPLIMLTANAMPEHVAASLEAGADAHLSKPFNVAQLLELTYNLIQKNYQTA